MDTHEPRPSRRWPAVSAVVVGAALVAAATIGLASHRAAPTDAGNLPVVVTADTTVTASPVKGPRPSTLTPTATAPTHARLPRTSTPAPTPSAVPSAAAKPSAANHPAPPATLSLPTLDVTAPVDTVDSVNGVLQVPDDVHRVGWWTGSTLVGAPSGSTVIDGHIDSAAQGEGALFHLADLQPGDPVAVLTTTGHTITYSVIARRVYVKADGLPADIFTDPGYPRLVLISCGGSFDSSERSYNDNIVVYATPTTHS